MEKGFERGMLYGISKVLLSVLFRLLFRIQGSGTEKIPREGGVLLACNHVSFLDIPCLGVICPRQVQFVAREDLFEHRLLGFLLKKYQPILIARGRSVLSAIRAVAKALEKEKVVCLFPEGTRSRDGQLKEVQLGIGFLAIKTGAPVVPVYIEGTHNALPRGQHWIRPYPVKVIFGEPIDPTEVAKEFVPKERYRQVAQDVMDSLRKLQMKRNYTIKEEKLNGF